MDSSLLLEQNHPHSTLRACLHIKTNLSLYPLAHSFNGELSLSPGHRSSFHLAMAISETPDKTYALAAVLSVLAIVAVILRFYSRRLLKTASIEIDDYMILPALVCQTLQSCQLLEFTG